MTPPETLYATVGNDRVAYQVSGNGPRDLVYTSGFWSHLDVQWEDAGHARMFRRLGSFARLIRFDRRGTGSSDHPTDDQHSIERWITDLLAVLDAAGARAPVVVSTIDSGPVVLQFVDRHPDRCSGLVFINTIAAIARAPGYPQGHPPEMIAGFRNFFAQAWGNPAFGARFAPSLADNPRLLQWYSKLQRAMASPRAVAENFDVLSSLDSRDVLPRVRVPTLVMARRHLAMLTCDQARVIADGIPGARFVELPGSDGAPAWEAPELILDHVEEFVTGSRAGASPDRALAAVLLTDLVDSTRHAAALGDAEWRRLLDQHDQVLRTQVEQFGGRLVEVTGDGALATFSRPGRALECARALHDALSALGLSMRAGAHLGEVELRDDGRVGG
ncbi:MAG TPA: alpha/beta fold hydrolase, partial [Nevskiaceae bacterium]|nr:alpha/beta fold hydrolase [Nevskiaceae bacterium]